MYFWSLSSSGSDSVSCRLASRARRSSAATFAVLRALPGVGPFTAYQACVDLGATFMVCDMGLRAKDIKRSTLRDDVAFVEGGLVTFLNDARADGAILFI